MAAKKYLVIGDLRGGRNGADAPLSLSDNQCVEALNVHWFEGTLAQKRYGATAVTMTSAAEDWTAFTGTLSSLCVASYSYVDTLVAVDSQTPAHVNYCITATYPTQDSWHTISSGDTIAGSPTVVNAVTFNNKCYVTFDSAVDRLHYWDYEAQANVFYRVGIPAPTAAPVVANYGTGAYDDILRYYKVAYTNVSGTDTLNRSELSAAASITPSGGGASVVVTMPAVPTGESITHWEVYGSADGSNYRLLASTAIATTVYYDSAAPASYSGDLAPTAGNNTVPGSWKYIASNGNRLFGVGNWEGGKQARVWFTPVYGASDVGDNERVPTANYIDLDAYDGDPATGIIGSFQGNVIVFKKRAIWKLVATGEADAPYMAVCLTRAIGCIAPKSLVVGEDETGNPALYFMSHRGPYRLGDFGLEYCGRDIEDLTARLNQQATVISHAVWHPTRHQVWFWIALDTGLFPTERVVFDTYLGRRGTTGVRGGWARHTGYSCESRCSTMFGRTLLSTAVHQGRPDARVDTVPYAGGTANVLLRCDDSTATADNTTMFQAYVKTKPYPLGRLGFNCSIGQGHLTAKAGDGVTITQTLIRDFGAESRESICSLTPDGAETRVQRQFEGADTAGAGVVQFQVGDDVASTQTWTLDALMVPYSQHEER